MHKPYLDWIVGVVAAAVLGSTSAHAATNLALMSEGASFVSASSFNVTAKNNLATMRDDLLTTDPVAWSASGETRYIFGHKDQDQWIEIDLGQVRLIDSIGALFPVPFGDRYVVGPFSVETSIDGSSWTAWGAPVAISHQTVKPVLVVSSIPEDVEYIKYFFGPSDPDYNYDGSSVRRLFAYGAALTGVPDGAAPTAVPEPSIWALMLVGVGAVGAAMRARRTREAI